MVSWKNPFKKSKRTKVKIIKKVIFIDKRKAKSPGQVLRERIARRKK